MTTREEIREEVKSIFSEDMLLCFWTHEKCPPTQQEFKQCQLDSDIKHERCMPCWEKWVDGLVDKVLKKEHELGVVIKVEREFPVIHSCEICEHCLEGTDPEDGDWISCNETDCTGKIKKWKLKAGIVATEPLIKEE